MIVRRALVLAALLVGACAQCEDGPDVLLALNGNATTFGAAEQLSLVLSIDGTPVAQQPAPIAGPFTSGTTVLLVPSSTPSSATYMLGVTATLLDASGAPLATGTMTFSSSTHACNREALALTTPSLDASVSDDGHSDGSADASRTDGSSSDLAHLPPVDLAGADLTCVRSTADEDGDGISDPCDVCAANYDATPTDTDGDGVPDACDPDETATNAVLLFEPFNTALGTPWTGEHTEASGALSISAASTCNNYAKYGKTIGTDFQIQTYETPDSFDGASCGQTTGDLGIYAIDSTGLHGVSCVAQRSTQDGAQLMLAQNDVLDDPETTGTVQKTIVQVGSGDVAVSSNRRLRLTVHGGKVSCELASVTTSGVVTVVGSISNITQVTPNVELSPALGACCAQGKFSSIFVVSD